MEENKYVFETSIRPAVHFVRSKAETMTTAVKHHKHKPGPIMYFYIQRSKSRKKEHANTAKKEEAEHRK